MNLKFACVAAATVLMLGGGARAATEVGTLEVGADLASNGQIFSDLTGSSTLSLSSRWLKLLSDASITLSALPNGALTPASSSGGAAAISMPLQALTTRIEAGVGLDLSQTVLATRAQGGFSLSSMAGGKGSSELRFTDLRVDLVNRTISADIAGSHGVGALNDHVLWSFDRVVGDTQIEWLASPVLGVRENSWSYSLPSLVLADASDVDNIFGKALNLSESQRRALRGLNDRNTEGFGSFSNAASLLVTPIPEPSAWALMVVGLAGLGVLRRRAGAR